MTSDRLGSIQIEVPVNPVWPKLSLESLVPALLPADGVSQPSARLEFGTTVWRRVNSRTTSGVRCAAARRSVLVTG